MTLPMLLLPRLLLPLLLTTLGKLQLFQLHTSTTATMVAFLMPTVPMLVPMLMEDTLAMLDTTVDTLAMLDTAMLDTHTPMLSQLLLPRRNKVQSSIEGTFGESIFFD